jgi:hypothetical protein
MVRVDPPQAGIGCSIRYITPAGNESIAAGFGTKQSDAEHIPPAVGTVRESGRHCPEFGAARRFTAMVRGWGHRSVISVMSVNPAWYVDDAPALRTVRRCPVSVVARR